MTRARTDPAGGLVVEAATYRLEIAGDGLRAELTSPDGLYLASLRLLAALDCTDALDETISVEPPRVVEGSDPVVKVARRSTCWEHARLTLTCADEAIHVGATVAGSGRLADVHLLAGRSLLATKSPGFLPSGSGFRTLFSPNPGDPARLVRSTGEAAVVGAVGDGEPGRGHWFFSPAPLYLALTTARDVVDPAQPVPDGWTGIGVVAPIDELTFGQLAYEPGDRAFSLRLDYDGHTEVAGEFSTPALVLAPATPDPYTGIRRHRNLLVERGLAPAPRPRNAPRWWGEPSFCGWGAQYHLALAEGRPAPDFSTQARYDAFLEALEDRGLRPGTVVIDDKWQEAYGTCLPDRAKWPNLRRWVAERHDRGQRVLLWWKAWDPEGLPPELCVRNPDGAPIAADPTNPGAAEALREAVDRMLGAEGIDADGLKVDFTSRTPAGRAVSTHGGRWGIALLHELLALVYAAAKEAKEDALVQTSSPHPSFVDVADMIRLNDMLRLGDHGPRPAVVPQMRFRAEVVRAACPELLIDTDDWCVPDKASWRAYQEVKPDLGVPSLYYATHLDLTGEPLDEEDYAAVRRAWDRWQEARQLHAEALER
jgi:hypothetical protein